MIENRRSGHDDSHTNALSLSLDLTVAIEAFRNRRFSCRWLLPISKRLIDEPVRGPFCLMNCDYIHANLLLINGDPRFNRDSIAIERPIAL